MSEENEQPKATKPESADFIDVWCKKLVAHPKLGAVTIILGIIGTVYGFYQGFASIRERELTVYYSPTRTPIVQQGKLENFAVTFSGKPITGDLSSVEIQLWNAGKETIRTENILKPISIQTISNQPIYQVTWQTTRDVVGFSTSPSDGRRSGNFELEHHGKG